MTEKLLNKPPFKYLFDLVFALMKSTKFAEGLYDGPELDIAGYTVIQIENKIFRVKSKK